MDIISSLLPFPPINWWAQIDDAETIIFDKGEHFEKMSYRNRYTISGANNVNQLSIPLVKGRNQRIPMAEVMIHNAERWQVQHWRTLVSVYKRSPYWEYYEQSLQSVFETPFEKLVDFNLASFQWLATQLKLKTEVRISDTFVADPPAGSLDLRPMKPADLRDNTGTFPKYYQVFEDRIGFVPNLSILDLLFSEGPRTAIWLKGNATTINPPKA